MVISELIEKLQEIQNKHGNIEVMFYSYGDKEKFTRYDIDYDKDDNKLYLGQLWNTRKTSEQRI